LKVLFLINPKSGTRRSYDVADIIHARCGGWTYEVRPSESKEALDGIIDGAVRDGFDVVYAVGGDGTVHEIAKRLVGKPIALGILPTGSGNGFARHIGLPMQPAASLDACQRGSIITIDSGEVNGTPFLGVMGAGFDAEIAHRFASSKVRGFRTYVKAGLGAFFTYRCETYEITIDGRTFTRRAFVVAVSNSSQYGNDAKIAPDASLRDGLLDLVIADEVSVIGALKLLYRLFAGTIHFAKNVEVLRGKEIVIRREREGPVHLDGEPFVMGAELRIAVRPQSLQVLVPVTTTRI
jgi:YegS/Rv2252/BmrU family lipid kinase